MENENMGGEQTIVQYISQKIKEGVSSDEIKKQLQAVGWTEEQVDSAYALGLVECGVPVPIEGDEKVFSKKSSAAEIVVNIFSFVVLAAVATSLGVLLFQVINYYFQDALTGNAYYYRRISSEAIHYSIAVLLVGSPMYYFSMRFWFGKFRADEGKLESRLTKWITYIVLLGVSVTIVGDLIFVLFRLLQGEVTARFFLKALVILLITGGIFGFYFLERKKVQYKKPIPRNIFQSFGMAAGAVIFISIIIGFFVAGSPATERKRTFDDRRASDLNSISNCVNRYANEFERLPNDLGFIGSGNYSYCGSQTDPENGKRYEYRVVSAMKESNGMLEGEFELCADFSLEFNQESVAGGESYKVYHDSSLEKWNTHEAGRSCDTQKVLMKKKVEMVPVISR